VIIPPDFLKAVRKAHRCVVLTGAGISAESGLATFRSHDGLWRHHNPMELATPEAFGRDPALVWEWYWYRREKALQARPNPGHRAVAELEDRFQNFLLATQNVDGLHQRAGSRRMVELHGNITRDRCTRCGKVFPGKASGGGGLPRCLCGGLMRPDVVWFGEPVPAEAWDLAWTESARAEIFIAVGTSGLVQPAASLPLAAKQGGAYLIEVNPEPTLISDMADLRLQAMAGEAMPALAEKIKMARNGKRQTSSKYKWGKKHGTEQEQAEEEGIEV
jgi:NAD-dependent deacetylase